MFHEDLQRVGHEKPTPPLEGYPMVPLTGQCPHFTGAGHTKTLLKEVKDQVLPSLLDLEGYGVSIPPVCLLSRSGVPTAGHAF